MKSFSCTLTGFVVFLFLTVNDAPAQGADDPLMKAAGTAAYRPPKDTVETLATIPMAEHDGRMLNATIFRPKVLPEKPMPAIVFIHGGGWRQGSHYNTYSAWMAERGYLVASIDYRLSKEAKWPAQIQDCKLGVRWLRANAEKYHIDPNRIGTWGSSAGGQLAACVGTMQDVPEYEGTGFENVSSKVQAVGVFCGPSDFMADWKYAQHIEDLFGVPREQNPELWKSASPALAVKGATPPFFIAHGENDTAVPFSQGQKLKEALEKAGNPVEWMPVKNGAHDFFLHTTGPDSVIEPNHETLMAALLAFFDRNLKETKKEN